MSRTPKVCPLMSVAFRDAQGANETPCIEHRCAWWTRAPVMEGGRMVGYEAGCAMRINALTDSAGELKA